MKTHMPVSVPTQAGLAGVTRLLVGPPPEEFWLVPLLPLPHLLLRVGHQPPEPVVRKEEVGPGQE